MTSMALAHCILGKYLELFLISNFRRDLNPVCILLGISLASDCGLPTFRNPLSVPSSRTGCKVVCHCFPPPLDVPTFAARCLYVRNDARDPSSERWNCGREMCPVILPKFRLQRKFRDLLHAANLRHGTDGFTSPPKKGVLRIFPP